MVFLIVNVLVLVIHLVLLYQVHVESAFLLHVLVLPDQVRDVVQIPWDMD